MNKTAAEIIQAIGDLVRDVWKQKENPEGLSKTLNDIAGYNWALAQWQGELEEEERQMKAELDLEKANLLQKYTNQGDAVNKAEIKVTLETAKMRQDYNKTAAALEKVKITNRANQAVMDAVRSRLSLIKGEIK